MSDKNESCSCFEERLNAVKNHVSSQLPNGAVDISFSWKDQQFFLSSDNEYSPVNPRVAVEYRKPKRGGGHHKNLSKDEITMTASHCCYCGRKLNRKEQSNG